MSLTVGSPAPNFNLKSNLDNEISLSDYKGEKNVVLIFYPLDFSGICSIQLPEYSGKLADFEAKDTVVLGVNRDSVHTHKAWANEFGIEVPLLADMNGATAKQYDVFLNDMGFTKRAVFLIDKEGVLRFQFVEESPGAFTLHADKVLEEIDKL